MRLRVVLLGGTVAGCLGFVLACLASAVATLFHHPQAARIIGTRGPTLKVGFAHSSPFHTPILAVGFLGHFALCIAWGIVFAMLAYGLSRKATIVAGALFGVFVAAATLHFVLPVLGLGAMAETLSRAEILLEDVVFGLGLGVGLCELQPRALSSRDRPYSAGGAGAAGEAPTASPTEPRA